MRGTRQKMTANQASALIEKSAERVSVFGSIEEYLGDFSPEMALRVEDGATPLFDPERDQFSPEVLDVIANPGRGFKVIPAQAVTIEGLLRAVQKRHSVDLTGEMGTGKTPMGCWLSRCIVQRWGRPVRIVVTCPNQLVKKWRDHFVRIIPDAQVVMVSRVGQLLHLRKAGAPVTTEVYIIPRDKGKLSYSWKPSAIRRETIAWGKGVDGRPFRAKVETFHCPRCGTKQVFEKDGEKVDAWIDYFGEPAGRPGRRRTCCGTRQVLRGITRDAGGNLIGNWEEVPCGEQLWHAYNGVSGRRLVPTPSGRGRWEAEPYDRNKMPKPGIAPRRVSPVEFIWRYNIRFDIYIPDEVHELSGEGSLQGRMFGWLAARSRKVINATGTYSGGYATNVLYRLWRTVPQRLRGDGLDYSEDGHAEFVKLYGVLQVESKYVAQHPSQSVEDLCLGRGKCVSRREKSLPGISPLLFARYLLPQSAFVRLLEMHEHLPTFEEKVHVVGLTHRQAKELQRMALKFEEHQRNQRAAGAPCRAWSAARAVFLRWPDRPWPEQIIWDRDKGGNRIAAFAVPELPSNIEYPKEKKLLSLIEDNLKRGRKCWVFTEMTGVRWEVCKRLVAYLGRHGIRATVLRTQQDGGPKPEDREEWIARHTPGCDVVISHPVLVRTGLDLYDFPTILFYYCGDSTYTLRQASRRAWRLGQLKPCEVHYLVYGALDETIAASLPPEQRVEYTSLQSAALTLMAKKMEASLALEGEFTSEGLAAMAESSDIQSQLAKVIAGKLQVGDPREAFASYRKKLEAIMPSIVGKAGDPEPAVEVPDLHITDLEPEPAESIEESAPAAAVRIAEAIKDMGPDDVLAFPSPALFPPAPVLVAEVAPRVAPATAKRRRTLTGLLALAEILAKDDPKAAAQLTRDVETLKRMVR